MALPLRRGQLSFPDLYQRSRTRLVDALHQLIGSFYAWLPQIPKTFGTIRLILFAELTDLQIIRKERVSSGIEPVKGVGFEAGENRIQNPKIICLRSACPGHSGKVTYETASTFAEVGWSCLPPAW